MDVDGTIAPRVRSETSAIQQSEYRYFTVVTFSGLGLLLFWHSLVPLSIGLAWGLNWSGSSWLTKGSRNRSCFGFGLINKWVWVCTLGLHCESEIKEL